MHVPGEWLLNSWLQNGRPAMTLHRKFFLSAFGTKSAVDNKIMTAEMNLQHGIQESL